MKIRWNISKNKVLFLLTVAGLFLVCVVFAFLEEGVEQPRYHQHLEEPSEAELEPCTRCEEDTLLCTHLPIIRIETGGQKIPGAAIVNDEYIVTGYETGNNGEELIAVDFSVVEGNGWHHADDEPDTKATAMIRYRGNSSRAFDKRNFLIKLVEEEDYLQNKDLSLLGMTADNEWALHGPFMDKTLLRNYMWMNISGEVMGYAPNVRFCEVVVDGQYQGVYVLMETISCAEGRVNMTKYEPGDPFCSYIVCIDNTMNNPIFLNNFSQYTKRMEIDHGMKVVYPGKEYQTEEVFNYINADFSEVERLLYSSNMGDDSGEYKKLMDVDSFVNYYILQEFLSVSDAFYQSTYFYKDVRGKLHVGPVWDYNNALDNFMRPVALDDFVLSQRGWHAKLMMDEEFVEQVISRYRQLRKGVLSDAYLNKYIDDTIKWLGSAVDRNFGLWGYSFDTEKLSPVQYRQPSRQDMREMKAADPEHYEQNLKEAIKEMNPDSYEEAVEWMRNSMLKRAAWLDSNIESLRQYCSDSKNASGALK